MEIGTYIDKAVGSELSGNMIDICPVGALTSKPYAFTGRSWELTKTESIDVLDATGAAIRVDSYGQIVRRILPRLNEDINEEWLGDKSRFACDGLAQQRLDRPYVRRDGKLVPCTWTEALEAVASKLKATAPERVAAIIGDLVDAETMVVLKDLFTHLNINTIDCRQDNAFYDTSTRAGYLFNTTIAGIENADACLLVGTNLRWEAPLLNARVRKRWLTTLLPVGLVGAAVDLTYPALHLGTTPQVLQELAEGRGEFATTLEKIHSQGGKIMLILGAAALAHRDAAAILDLCSKITTRYGLMTDTWNGFNILQHAASRVAALDLGLVPRDPSVNVTKLLDQCSRGDTEVMYLLGADEIDTTKLQNTFVIYQGHHGDRGAHVADVILPGAAYTEKSGTYINTEGRVQHTQVAVFPPGEAKEDWKILRALADALGVEMHMNTLAQVRQRLVEVNPVFQTLNQITPAPWHPLGTTGTASDTPFNTTIHDYYMTDPISRHSPTMAKCRQTFGGSQR
jgi:NADH-quinone oxidoreductase subunit G